MAALVPVQVGVLRERNAHVIRGPYGRGAVEGGIHGKAPDLEALVDGDIRMQTDFRGVYAGLIARWWDAPDNFLAREGHGPSPLTRSRMS